jgi:hypothetical protein
MKWIKAREDIKHVRERHSKKQKQPQQERERGRRQEDTPHSADKMHNVLYIMHEQHHHMKGTQKLFE